MLKSGAALATRGGVGVGGGGGVGGVGGTDDAWGWAYQPFSKVRPVNVKSAPLYIVNSSVSPDRVWPPLLKIVSDLPLRRGGGGAGLRVV